MSESAATAIREVTARLRRRLDDMKFQIEQLERTADLMDAGLDPSQITRFFCGVDDRNPSRLARVELRDGTIRTLNEEQATKLRLLTQFKRGISHHPIGADHP
jgi:hypothetical protein